MTYAKSACNTLSTLHIICSSPYKWMYSYSTAFLEHVPVWLLSWFHSLLSRLAWHRCRSQPATYRFTIERIWKATIQLPTSGTHHIWTRSGTWTPKVVSLFTTTCHQSTSHMCSFQSQTMPNLQQHSIRSHNEQATPLLCWRKSRSGETFVINAICDKVRSLNIIILPTIMSAFAAQLYPGGRTTYSMFKVSLSSTNYRTLAFSDTLTDPSKWQKSAADLSCSMEWSVWQTHQTCRSDHTWWSIHVKLSGIHMC